MSINLSGFAFFGRGINLLCVPPLVVRKWDTRPFAHCSKKLLIIKKLLQSIGENFLLKSFLLMARLYEQFFASRSGTAQKIYTMLKNAPPAKFCTIVIASPEGTARGSA